jgi:dUTP pyrophosphatase
MILVGVYNVSGNALPEYSKSGDAGKDVRASEGFTLHPGDTRIINTGLYVAIPEGYEIQVRPRSGLSVNTKLRVANSPGTIDSNFRGELCVIMDNIGGDSIIIRKGDRIGQLVLAVVPVWDWNLVGSPELLGDTNRGINGFGSTGVQ